MAESRPISDLTDFTRGLRDGDRCAPVKDSLDLVECINSVRDRRRSSAANTDAYDAGIAFTQWRLQDLIFQALQKIPDTARSRDFLKVSHDFTVAAFAVAQRSLQKASITDSDSLGASELDNESLKARWKYWNAQPVPTWVTRGK